MSKEQTVIRVLQLQQTGRGFLTKTGEETLQKFMQQEESEEHSGKDMSSVMSVSCIARVEGS